MHNFEDMKALLSTIIGTVISLTVYSQRDTLVRTNNNRIVGTVVEITPHSVIIETSPTDVVKRIEIGQHLKEDKNIPSIMENLVALKGIGRKSANVIMREMKLPAEGIIADLHVIRVAPRIGLISESKDGNKVEKQLMQILPKEIWGEIGMSLSFLGREICRPTNPKCDICPINANCNYYNSSNM